MQQVIPIVDGVNTVRQFCVRQESTGIVADSYSCSARPECGHDVVHFIQIDLKLSEMRWIIN